MTPTSSDYEALAEEQEQSETAFYFAQWRHHLDEAKKFELKISQRQNRTDDVETDVKADRNATETKRRSSGSAERKPKKGDRRARPSSRRRFLMEGPTTVIVRLLYENRAGMSNFEMQARNGIAIKGRVIRKTVNRLVAAGCAVRQGKKVVLTETGITAWEASPLFLRSSRNSRGHAA